MTRTAPRAAICILVLSASIVGCDTSYRWNEEVELSDGRTVMLERSQTRAFRDPLTREGGYSKYFALALDGPVRVTWADSLSPVAFDIDAISPLIVVRLRGGDDCERFAHPRVPFVALRPGTDGTWRQVELSAVPAKLRVNLLLEPFRPEMRDRSGPVTLREKNAWNNQLPKNVLAFRPDQPAEARTCSKEPVRY